MAVLRERQWDLDASGRLPRSKRITTPRGLRHLPASSMKESAVRPAPARPPAPGVDLPAVEPVDGNEPPLAAWERSLVEPPSADGTTPVAGSAYIAVLQARELGVDHTYQRPLDEPRVRRMVAAWNPRMLGTIDVSDRGPGQIPRYAVINGQHRAAAAARVSPAGGEVWLPCTIHEGLDVAAEARLMHDLDRSTKKLTSWDKWRARRGAGDPAVGAIERLAADSGFTVQPHSFGAVGAAERLYAAGGEDLLRGGRGPGHRVRARPGGREGSVPHGPRGAPAGARGVR
jgi:hypothetical protein